MPAPDIGEFAPTHGLSVESGDFHEVTTAVLDAALDRATAGYVQLRHDELAMDDRDAEHCRRTWENVRDSFSWTDGGRPGAWYRISLPEGSDELRRVWSLEDGPCGVFFVHDVVLADGDDVLFHVVPHSSCCRLNAPDDAFVSALEDAPTGHRAAVFPQSTRIEWTDADHRYRIARGALRVGDGNPRERGRYRLWKLARMDADFDALTLSLAWRERRPTTVPGTILAGVESLVSEPPERLRFDDEATLRDVERIVREIRGAYHE